MTANEETAMKLTELTHEQQVALVALLEMFTLADGVVTEEEEEEIGHVAAALGDDSYRELLDEAEEAFVNADDLKAYLASISDEEARDLIYGTVLEEAVIRAPLSQTGGDMLEWMAKTWDIHVDMSREEEPREGEKEF
jgi:hypothetical protein